VCCSRPPLTVLALVGSGLGLPLSEEVLVLGLGATMPSLSATRRLCVIVWLLIGIVASDVTTASIGGLLRRRADDLRAQAPRFGGKLLKSVGQQLSVESRRDAKRLERQLNVRLRASARSASELLSLLTGRLVTDEPAPPPPVPPIPSPLRLQLLRRATCNTRSALAATGQAGPRLLRKLTQASAGEPLFGRIDLPYMRTRLRLSRRRRGGGGRGGGGGGAAAGGC